jgi:uncharacterized protein
LQDWEAALQFVRGQLGGQVDADRVTLWGNSYSGGHVLVLASRHPAWVTSVIAQVRVSLT